MTVIPLLPCASIDDMLTFYTALGFTRTYRQTKPNPYLAMRRDDVHLHFFGMPGFEPADSYGSCIIQVPDTAVLHRAFADGLRDLYGKVPLAGIPRMTRPRPRKNAEGLTGFTVVDPGGNWLRISRNRRMQLPTPRPMAQVPPGRSPRHRTRPGNWPRHWPPLLSCAGTPGGRALRSPDNQPTDPTLTTTQQHAPRVSWRNHPAPPARVRPRRPA
ncbi:VOC family protein [Pseudarthrobacter sulfonivorans]|uniref:bleomycin resistance protein n=1 Tax=Pseudarthrobacter sulfonivorans TaxID=121292 RepID=UPI0028549EAD|nr:VOC family protein [Pseudarthrobacter sulfonivorans]MDR6415186.1 catechol 2,3-dioxygenase-like lactoylglutathione lyase family enzyme [Pseudarthrobacter sulfonivorans]